MFHHVMIIGCGLIGASICHAVKRAKMKENSLMNLQVTVVDNNPQHLAAAESLQLADCYHADAAAAAKADLLILAVPVGSYAAVMRPIAANLPEGCVISDVGSTKASMFAQLESLLPASCDLIPAHPVAGTENSGPDAGFANLFDDRYVIVTPDARAKPENIDKLCGFWEALGAKTERMSAAHHDRVLAMTSHLPHLIAYTIVGTAQNMAQHLSENNDSDDVIRYAAGGFRDFTRIAASDPVMWRDIFLNNQEAVLEVLQKFCDDLQHLQHAIARGDAVQLQQWFADTREIRRKIIEQKQAGSFAATEQES